MCDAAQVLGPRACARVCAFVQDEARMAKVYMGLVGLVLGVLAQYVVRRLASRGTPVLEAPTEASSPKRSGGKRTVVLLGSEQSGKTNVFLRLSMGVAPDTATTQHVNRATVPADGAASQQALDLIDVPGHARLRTQAWDYLDTADALVFCIDASVASRGGSEGAAAAAALSTMKRTDLQGALIDSVDYLHDTLRTLAQRRLEAGATAKPPPALLILFTRMDRSPLFQDKSMLDDEKRRAQLLARCRRGLETALVSRRTSRGLHRTTADDAMRGRVTIDSIQEVQSAEQTSWLQRAKAAAARVPFLASWLPSDEKTAAELHPTRFGHNVRAGEGHKLSEELALDYLVAASGSAMDQPLHRLHPRVVEDGHAAMGLSHVDRAGWAPQAGQDHLGDLYTWIASL